MPGAGVLPVVLPTQIKCQRKRIVHPGRRQRKCTGLMPMCNKPGQTSTLGFQIIYRLVTETAPARMGDMVNASTDRTPADPVIKIHG